MQVKDIKLHDQNMLNHSRSNNQFGGGGYMTNQ